MLGFTRPLLITADLRGARPPLPVVAALFALLIQAFLVQPHIHFDTNWGALAAARAHSAAQGAELPAPASEGDVDHCLICHEQMSSGGTIVIDVVSVLPPNAATIVASYAEALCAAYGIISHSWQGRGPPHA